MHRTHIALALLALALAAGRASADDPPAGSTPPRNPMAGVIDYPVPSPGGGPAAPMLYPPDPLRTIAGFALEHGLAAVAIGAVLFGCLGVHVANRRELPAAEGLVCGALFWALGVVVVLLLPSPAKGQGA